MLHILRRLVRSWFAKALIAVLVLSFAAWGIGDIFITRASNTVAAVGNHEISVSDFATAFRVRLEQMNQGDREVSIADAVSRGIDHEVIESLAERTALDIANEELKISAPDSAVADTITEYEVFKDGRGQFDPQLYARVLAANGLAQKEFEARVRRDISQQQLIESIYKGVRAPTAPLRERFAYSEEKRKIAYLQLGPDQASDPADPEEEEIETYLDENGDDFMTPERRDFVFLWLSPDHLAEPDDITEEEAQDYYDVNLDLYGTVGSRGIHQMVFETEEEARAAHERLTAEIPLVDIAEERGLTLEDIDLGTVTKEELPENLRDAAFDLVEPGPVEPVETDYGWAVQEVTAVTLEEFSDFEEVREEIVEALAREAALDKIPELAVEVEDARAAGSTIEEIGDELGLDVHNHAGLDNGGVDVDGNAAEDLPADRAFLQDVFNSEIGEDADLVDLEDGGIYLLRVDAITESRPQTLEEARDEIIDVIQAKSRADEVLVLAELAHIRVNGGEELADIAAEYELELKTPDAFTRTRAPWDLGADLSAEIFELEVDELAFGPAWSPGTAAVLQLQEIVLLEGEELDEHIDGQRENIELSLGTELYNTFTQHLIDEHGLEINQASVEAALGLLSGDTPTAY